LPAHHAVGVRGYSTINQMVGFSCRCNLWGGLLLLVPYSPGPSSGPTCSPGSLHNPTLRTESLQADICQPVILMSVEEFFQCFTKCWPGAVLVFRIEFVLESRDSSVGISTAWMAGVLFPARVRTFSSLKRSDRFWGPPRLGTVSSDVNRQGREADQSNVEIKNGGALPPFPYTSSWPGP
jgi:hypothetical protein